MMPAGGGCIFDPFDQTSSNPVATTRTLPPKAATIDDDGAATGSQEIGSATLGMIAPFGRSVGRAGEF